MATRSSTIALEVVADVADSVRGLGSIETAAQGAAREVGNLSSAADTAPAKLDAVAGAAGGLDEKTAAATGALGALASGFELVGNEKAAEALGAAALATDFLSGVGQTAALAVQAQAGATKALTIAQKAANVAMRANPIGLVVTAILLLVGGLVLAYNKSETFREIIQRAGAAGKAAMGAVVNAVSDVVTWVRDRIPPVFAWFKDKAAKVIEPAKLAISTVVDVVQDLIGWVGDLPAKFGALKDKAAEIAAPLLAPFSAVRDALEWISDKIDNLKIPDWLGKLNPLGRSASSSADTLFGDRGDTTTPTAAAPVTTVNITVTGALDPYAVAVQIQALLARYNLAVGVV